MKKENIIDTYVKQATENHALKGDTNFWLVVKQKPNWMPMFLYKMVIKNLVEVQQHQSSFPPPLDKEIDG